MVFKKLRNKFFVFSAVLIVALVGLFYIFAAVFYPRTFEKGRLNMLHDASAELESVIRNGMSDIDLNMTKLAIKYDVNWELYDDRGEIISGNNYDERTGCGLLIGKADYLRYLSDFYNSSEKEKGIKIQYTHKGSSGFLYYYRLDDDKIIVTFTFLDAKSEFARLVIRSLQALVLPLILVGVLLAYGMARHFAAPIEALGKGIEKVATGHNSMMVAGHSRDEVGGMVKHINDIANIIYESKKSQSDMASNISGDILQGLRMIVETANQLLGQNMSREQRSDLYDIIAESDIMLEEFEQVAELSRLQAGMVAPDKKHILLNDMFKTIKERFEILYAAGYMFEWDIDYGEVIVGDRDILNRVMAYLINNAINFSGDSTKVRVSAKTVMDGVRFSVQDFGAPISDKDLHDVWDIGVWQLGGFVFDEVSTGLELAIVREYLSVHGYKYGVKNSEDGKVFWFIAEKAAEESEQAE